ncbi:MAG: DUF2064 domain-containing protein [Chloroflexi bacterium]|nr:DUF2064 domain-containing protein [Chloroflexota bacterium]
MAHGGNPTRGPAAGLLVRPPAPGRVKRRLATAIGHEGAALLAEAMLLDAVAAVREAHGWRPILFAEPSPRAGDMAALTGVEDTRTQAAGGLGRRTLAALRDLARDGYSPIAVLSADVPLLTAGHLEAARSALTEADVVFGPAAHGGFYLAAMWEPWPELFETRTVEWGGTRVFSSIERIALARGTRFQKLAMERDVDSPADLEWLRSRVAALEERGEAMPAHTAKVLRALGSSVGA